MILLLLLLIATLTLATPSPTSALGPTKCADGWSGSACNISALAEHYYALAKQELRAAKKAKSKRLRNKDLAKATYDYEIAKGIEEAGSE